LIYKRAFVLNKRPLLFLLQALGVTELKFEINNTIYPNKEPMKFIANSPVL